jgi:branched-chain amino acid transport system substrate-binding protein
MFNSSGDRRALSVLAPLCAVLALVAPAAAQTVKVGYVVTLTGLQAGLGETIQKATNLYMKLHANELPAGVTIEPIWRDDTGPNPDLAKRLAQELVVRDHVQFLSGITWTPNAMAVAAFTKQSKTPTVMSGNGAPAVTRESPYVIKTSFTVWQACYPLGKWAATHGITGAYTAVADYAGGVDAENAFTKGFTEAGGKILGSVRIPLSTVDYLPYVQRIKDAKPPAVFAFAPGAAAATAYMKAFEDLGVRKAGIKIIGPGDITDDMELQHMGPAVLGVETALYYSAVGTWPADKAFVAAWHKEYGADDTPGFFSVNGWDAIAAIYAAVKAQNGKIDPDKTMAILSHWKNPDSPRGPLEIDPETRDVIHNVYMRRVEMLDGKLANVVFDTIPMVKDPWKEFNPVK